MRCNCGIDPKYLADQHLLAEAREIPMVTGSLRANGYAIKSPIPNVMNLGTGYINFFKDKQLYLLRRRFEVIKECYNRGFDIQQQMDICDVPIQFKKDWTPSQRDTTILRQRVITRLGQGNRQNWYRYYGKTITTDKMSEFQTNLLFSPLYFV